MKLYTLTVFFVFFIITSIRGQNQIKALKVGDQLPDITLRHLLNSKGKVIRITDYRGKILIIDFWATWCVPCVKDLPRIDSLQLQFKDQIAILPVTDQNESTVSEFLKSKESLKSFHLPIVYSDAILNSLFPHRSVPHDVVIDGNGKVLAILNSANINEDSIGKFIKGQQQSLVSKDVDNLKFDIEEPFFIDSSARSLLLIHRMITKHYSGMSLTKSSRRYSEQSKMDYRLMGTNMQLLNMYRVALLKRLSTSADFPNSRINLKVKNLAMFKEPESLLANEDILWSQENTYCYDFIVPKNSKINVYQLFKEDLDAIFHVKSKIETQMVDCYVLKAVDSTKYKSNTIAPNMDMAKELWSFKGESISDMMIRINPKIDFILVNETGIKNRIDISFRPFFNDVLKLKSEFNKYGLDIVKGKRLLDVISIEDQ